MDSTLMVNKVLNLDKTSWKLTKVGDLAKDISKRVDNPGESEYDRFVSLRNFVAGDIKIKTWEPTENLASSAKAFKAGDILFARRNAYLRRASLVDFDGCCSGDAFVLRENHDKIVPGFLAFLMNSNALWDYANSNAAGTMSKRVKWRDLAEYEFLLPPKDQQVQLAKLLWAMDGVVEKEKEVLKELDNTYLTLVDNLFSKNKEDWKDYRLDKISSINSDSLNSKTDPDYEFQYLDLASIIEPKVIGEMKIIKYNDAPSRAKRIVSNNSIVLAMVRPYQKSFAFVEIGKDIVASTGTAIINMHDANFNRFVFHQFFSKKFTRYCEDRMSGTNYPAITPKDIQEYKVSIPNDRKLINVEASKLDRLEQSSRSVKNKVENSQSLQKSLINQIF